MLKKVFSLFLVFCFFASTSFAQVADSKSIATQAIDELNFKLNVIWDQKDKDFYNTTIKSFNEKIKNSGISSAEYIDLVSSKVLNEKDSTELKNLFNSINKEKVNVREAQELAAKYVAKTKGVEGASYLGDPEFWGWVGGVIAVAAIVALIVWACHDGGCSGGSDTHYDTYSYDYYDYYNHEWCTHYDYYDSNGYYVYSDTVCW